MKYINYILISFITLVSCNKNIRVYESYGMLPNVNYGDKVIYEKTTDNVYDYGDVIIFDSEQGFLSVFRVVGLPGDSIALDDYMCIINGKKNKWEKIAENISFERIRVPDTGEERVEELPNGVKVRLYKETQFSIEQERTIPFLESQYIPERHYFVLGDVRTKSIDSRYWGPIPVKNIKGKVVKVIKK